MIALDDEHGILDGRPARSINQATAFEHDLRRLRLGPSAGASNKHAQENTQDHQNSRTIDGFHLTEPRVSHSSDARNSSRWFFSHVALCDEQARSTNTF